MSKSAIVESVGVCVGVSKIKRKACAQEKERARARTNARLSMCDCERHVWGACQAVSEPRVPP